MAEPTIIEQQRELLRTYQQIDIRHANAKSYAEARLKEEQKTAKVKLNQVLPEADEQLSQIQKILTKGQEWLEEGKWYNIIAKASTRPTESQPRKHPATGMSDCISQADKALGALESRLVAQSKGKTKVKYSFQGVFSLLFIIPISVSLLSYFVTKATFAIYYQEQYTALKCGSQYINRRSLVRCIGLADQELFLGISVATGVFVFFVILCIYYINKYIKDMLKEYTELIQTGVDAEYWHDLWVKEAEQSYERELTDAEAQYREEQADIQQRFSPRIATLRSAFADLTAEADSLSPAWDMPLWGSWQAAVTMAKITRLGQLEVGKKQEDLLMPALLAFPGERSLLFKASASGKSAAVQTIQSLILRLLGSIPPGKLHCTFFDPVGLGQNVASFMQLADHDDKLVTSRAWTEPRQIEQRLSDLTEQMANVIQRELRNEHATIEQYNQQAREMALPYRLLVVMDFPVNFSEQTARRLVSIAHNGPRCGIYTIILIDPTKPLPDGFNMADLELGATVIAWDGKRFVWQDEDFADCRLELDTPPDAKLFDQLLKGVGEAAKSARRVVVPFERIAPPPEKWWRGSTQEGLQLRLGLSTGHQSQLFSLGKGYPAHVLVAGKRGTGKSTLFHLLITTLALTYSPQEIEFYLIDFKEGVEFNSYAGKDGHPPLPHARVIALESEREFGVNVLQGLNAELKRRGELYRRAGAQNFTHYREKSGQIMPRLLLFVDEVEEFFSEDDEAEASAAAQLIERLVRQGASFGIHLLLSSQSLAAPYRFIRSTLDKMALRIAFQSSDADSRLILAADNRAARLLSRPGEAIYNAQGGIEEGNHFFQAAWLSDEQREHYLKQIEGLARKLEGNAPAEIEDNQALRHLLTSYPSAAEERELRTKIWLGEFIATGSEPTYTLFDCQSGCNLLIVGQDQQAARAMMTISLVSLMAHVPPSQQIFFVIFDFSALDGPHANYFKMLTPYLPRPIKVMHPPQLPQMINNFHSEVQRRIKRDETSAPPIYLLLYGLQDADALRQNDSFDDGSSFNDEAPNLAQKFATILHKGAQVGVHTIAWCDSLTNSTSTAPLDRQTQAQFVMRVAFQMSSEDSTNLLDSPVASQLEEDHALFYHKEENRIEKFRPYRQPSKEWLAWVGEQLRGRSFPLT